MHDLFKTANFEECKIPSDVFEMPFPYSLVFILAISSLELVLVH